MPLFHRSHAHPHAVSSTVDADLGTAAHADSREARVSGPNRSRLRKLTGYFAELATMRRARHAPATPVAPAEPGDTPSTVPAGTRARARMEPRSAGMAPPRRAATPRGPATVATDPAARMPAPTLATTVSALPAANSEEIGQRTPLPLPAVPLATGAPPAPLATSTTSTTPTTTAIAPPMDPANRAPATSSVAPARASTERPARALADPPMQPTLPTDTRATPEVAAAPVDVPALPGAGDAPLPPGGTVKSRLRQLIHIHDVPYRPAIQFDGWNETAVAQICDGWRNEQVAAVSIPAFSRLCALNFERAHADEIPAHLNALRLLPDGSSERAYYDEMVKASLAIVGIDDAHEVDRILASFQNTGTGGLHRQRVMGASLLNGGLSVAQYAASASPPVGLALSVVQGLVTLLSSAFSFQSLKLRFLNAGTEDVMPLARSDATPGAKVGHSLAYTSATSVLHLHKLIGDVRRIDKAMAAHAQARTPGEQADADEALAIAFARFCAHSEKRLTQKEKNESGAIEFRGNEKTLLTSYVAGLAALSTTVMGIITPAVLSAKATMGASAALLLVRLLLYVGPQLSPWPSREGARKLRRGFVAVGKLPDLLSPRTRDQQRARAQIWREYIAARRAAKGEEARAGARTAMLDALRRVAQEDNARDDVTPLQNWTDYAHFNERARAIQRVLDDARNANDTHNADTRAAPGGDLETLKATVEQALHELDAEFSEAHRDHFQTDIVLNARKPPYRMRFENMDRLLGGTVSVAARKLADAAHRARHKRHDAPDAPHTARDARRDTMRAGFRRAYVDWINFAWAHKHLKDAGPLPDPANAAVSGPLPAPLADAVPGSEAARQRALPLAAAALFAVRNEDAQALFTGDGRRQVEATRFAKTLAAGEEERYTVTGSASATIAATADIAGGAYSIGLHAIEHGDATHGVGLHPRYGDQRDGQLLPQGTAPFTAHYTSAERARAKETLLDRLWRALLADHTPLKLTLALPTPAAGAFSSDDPAVAAALDELADAIEAHGAMPDEIALSVEGETAATLKLNRTSDFYKGLYDRAPLRVKARFHFELARAMATGSMVSIVSPLVQGAATGALRLSRSACYDGLKKSPDVRTALTESAQRRPAPADDPARSGAAPAARDVTGDVTRGVTGEVPRLDLDLGARFGADRSLDFSTEVGAASAPSGDA
jgi:hypothetical protein